MERRTLLGLLLAGGTGAAVVWSQSGDDQSRTAPPPDEDSAYGRIHRKMLQREGSPDFGPNYEFDYGHVEAENVEHRAVEHLSARAAPEGDGDRLRLRPASMTASRLREWLLAIWYVEDTDEVVGSVEDERLTFRGGESQGYSYLVSVPETDESPVWAVRAETTEAARRIAGA